MGLVQGDVVAGKLVESPTDWRSTFREAVRLAQAHAAVTGCRSLDTLHCALAKVVSPSAFLSSDARQIQLAPAAGRFFVEGEKRYWLQIAIDRFDGTVVGQQLEEVVE
jgi:hypothetical protein